MIKSRNGLLTPGLDVSVTTLPMKATVLISATYYDDRNAYCKR